MGRSHGARGFALAAVLLALGLAGCGRAGAPEAPPDASVPVVSDQSAVEQVPRRPKKVPIAHPTAPFLLDPLL